MNKSDPILVTGAGGLVGSHMVDLLLTEGYTTVYGLSHDMCDLTSVGQAQAWFGALKPKHVFHAAAVVYGIKGNMDNQARSYLDNTRINTNVIEAAHITGVEKITVMGTGAVYPYKPTRDQAFTEESIFDGRPDPHEAGYAHAKRGMLAMLEAYKTSYGMQWAYIVSCNLFGPRDKFDPVNGHVTPALVRKFYEAKRDGTPVTIWGDGSAQRDFLYVKDAVRVGLLAMDHAEGPINMGSGTVYFISDVVGALSKISGVTDIRWDPTKPNGVEYRAYWLQKLNALSFNPQYTLEQGLQETWDWYCDNQK